MILVTPMSRTGMPAQRGRYGVWEYDEDKPRNLAATDPRARYAVKRFVGGFRTLEDAERAAANVSGQ